MEEPSDVRSLRLPPEDKNGQKKMERGDILLHIREPGVELITDCLVKYCNSTRCLFEFIINSPTRGVNFLLKYEKTPQTHDSAAPNRTDFVPALTK